MGRMVEEGVIVEELPVVSLRWDGSLVVLIGTSDTASVG